MRHTIPKRERLFRRMQQLAQNGMVAGQKLRPICQGDVNHSAPHSQQYLPQSQAWVDDSIVVTFPKSS
jgi:hypothetical protein